MYCHTQDVVLRIAIVDEEVEVYVRHRDKREFKAVYDSKLVGLALSRAPIAITKEQYENFSVNQNSASSSLLNLTCILYFATLEDCILSIC